LKHALKQFLIDRLADESHAQAPTEQAERLGLALIVTDDKASHQWGPGWLRHVGLDVRMTDSPSEALGLALATRADLVIVDHDLRDERDRYVLEVLRGIHGEDMPIIALCRSRAEVGTALATGATDVVCRPYDWQIVAHRALRALEAREAQAKLRFATSALERLHESSRADKPSRRAPDATDALTGLPNGEKFRALLQATLNAAAEANDPVGVAILGVEDFETVNDRVGTSNANQVLQEFAQRFRECLDDREVIGSARGGISAPAASLGGARFAILVADSGEDEIERFRAALDKRLERPFRIDGHCFYLKAVIGTAIGEAAETSPDALLHEAETNLVESREGD